MSHGIHCSHPLGMTYTQDPARRSLYDKGEYQTWQQVPNLTVDLLD